MVFFVFYIVYFLNLWFETQTKTMIKFFLNKIPRKYIQKIAEYAIPLASPLFYGRAIECPICKGKFRNILPYGYVSERQNALCPRCLGLERHRMMWYYLTHYTDFFEKPLKVLHVAPEHPFIKRFQKTLSSNFGEYITADLESPWATVKMDVQDIPFPDESFDVVFCNHVLEHVESDLKALSELFRVSKQGAWGILLSPIDYDREFTYEDSSIVLPEERLKHFGQKDHLRVFGRDYSERLSSVGFEVQEIKLRDILSKSECDKMAFSSETLYIVNKPKK